MGLTVGHMLLKDLPREALLRPLTRREVVGMLLRLTIFGAATYYSIKWVVEAMDPTYKQKNLAKKKVRWSPLLSSPFSFVFVE